MRISQPSSKKRLLVVDVINRVSQLINMQKVRNFGYTF